jgi:hypothetical protein
MAKAKYEVVDYKSGGFFVHGGALSETFIKNKEDADMICDALNTVERMKLVKKMRCINNAILALEDLDQALKQN